MPTAERYVPITEAARRFDVPHRTLTRRISDGSLVVYQDDRDRRRRLLDVTDVMKLADPRPVRPLVGEVSAA